MKDKLTKKEERDLAAWFDECMRIGTCTDRAYRQTAESAIAGMYAVIGEAKPQFIWFDGPAAACVGYWFLKNFSQKDSLGASLWDSLWDSLGASLWDSLWDSLGASLRASLWDSLRASLWDSLGASLRASLWDSLGASLGDSLWDSLGASLGDSLWDSLGASLWDSLWDSLRASLWDSLGASLRASLWDSLGASLGASLRASLGGQLDQFWIGFYQFAEKIGVCYDPKKSRHLKLWYDVARSMGWWMPYKSLCLCCERPTVCKIDENRLLHCGDGPAMAFADGWEVHAIHNVRVSKQIVENPATLTITQIGGEQNAEVRRIMIERFTWPRYLREAGANVIDNRRNDIEGTRESLMRTDRNTVLVCACPSTARVYALEVPNEVTTCRQAQAWLSGGLSERIVSAS